MQKRKKLKNKTSKSFAKTILPNTVKYRIIPTDCFTKRFVWQNCLELLFSFYLPFSFLKKKKKNGGPKPGASQSPRTAFKVVFFFYDDGPWQQLSLPMSCMLVGTRDLLIHTLGLQEPGQLKVQGMVNSFHLLGSRSLPRLHSTLEDTPWVYAGSGLPQGPF